MSISSITSNINRLEKDIATLEKQTAAESDKELRILKTIDSLKNQANRTGSAATLKSKLNQIRTKQAQLGRIEKKKADLARKISDNNTQLRRYQISLRKEQEKEQKKIEQEQLNFQKNLNCELKKQNNHNMDKFLDEAINEARIGLQEGGIPIGSVLVHNGQIIGKGHNRRIQQESVVLHGEMDALENAGRQPASVYRESVLYTTLSPCPMCTGAILLYGIPKVIIGENQTFQGSESLLAQNGVEVVVVNDAQCIEMMQDFIEKNPTLWNEDIGEP